MYQKVDKTYRLLKLAGVQKALTKRPHMIKPAFRRDEFEGAFRLVYERYKDAKMILPNRYQLWFTRYHALPETRVILGLLPELPIPACTASLVFDSVEFGLPSDAIFPDKLDQLRRQGCRLVEFCSLAALPHLRARGLIFHIFRVLYRYALWKGATDLVISVRPEHAAFYEKVLLFKRIGPKRLYPNYYNLYAVLQHISLEQVPYLYRKAFGALPKGYNLYQFFVRDELPLNLDLVQQAGLSREDLIYFFIERTNMWFKLSEADRVYLAHLYDLFPEKYAASLSMAI